MASSITTLRLKDPVNRIVGLIRFEWTLLQNFSLVILYKGAAQESSGLCLVAPCERVTRLLEITKLSDLFRQFAEETSALEWIRSKQIGTK